MADDFERGGSKLYAALARSLADDPMVAAIVGDREPFWEAPLGLWGGAEGGPPPGLFGVRVAGRRRPVTVRRPGAVRTDHGPRLLEAFVWADQTERLERVRKAIEIVRAEPPRLMEGDFVE